MAEFSTLVAAVHEVYQQEGGDYDEGTAPALMSVSKTLWEGRRTEIRATDDSVDVVVSVYYDEIISALQAAA